MENDTVHEGGHGHLHAHGHVSSHTELLRHRVITQVLELGIIVHSVIIGIALGTSESPSVIKPLVAALSFHQFFEGMGLGSCIAQGNFKWTSVTIMGLFFALTTPASSGILIYMALVDLLAADFMNPRMQNSGTLRLIANMSLLLGAGFMSLIAKWA